MGRPRKPLWSSGHRGFESHSFRGQCARYSAFWLTKVSPGLEPTSVGRYRQRIGRINEHLGDVALGDLSGQHVAAALAKMGKTLKPATVNATRSVLGAIVRSALGDGLIDRDPTAGVRGVKCPARSAGS